ncbi:MAG: hypothetical protein KY475_15450, partial [Planctomycetes bacterium]|nr:hypothetical protein [Planctomycetota bacterium]
MSVPADQPPAEPFQPNPWGDAPFDGAFRVIERHCLRCNGRLYDGGPSECPACGLQYDGANPETYRDGPMFLRWKFWFPGFATAVVTGVIAYAVCLQAGDLGFALFAAVPLSV